MDTKSIDLPEALSRWVDDRVGSGEFADPSDYVRELIRRDQAQREWLIGELIAGEESGIGDRTVEDIWAEAEARHKTRKRKR